jgi:hypothetical protein
MTTSIPASAEEAALPPGLAERAAAMVEPGEAVLWAGQGRRASTFAALWSYPAVLLLVLALLAWLGLSLADQSAVARSDVDPLNGLEVPAPLVLVPFALACLWLILTFLYRVLVAPWTLWVLTPRRLIVGLGRRRTDFDLVGAYRAVVSGPHGRSVLALEIPGDGSRGSGARPSLFGVVNTESAIEVLERLGVAVSDERPEPGGPDSGPAPIAPGESIRWSGRRGFRATGANRLLMLGMAGPLLLPFIWGVWAAWSKGNSMDSAFDKLLTGGGLLFLVCLYLGPIAWLALGHAPAFLGDLFVEIFGRLVVTDRRILFTMPLTGAVQREVRAERIVEALLIDVDERGRGYISLTLKGEEGEKDEIMDLYSVPDPDNALDSIGRLIRRP